MLPSILNPLKKVPVTPFAGKEEDERPPIFYPGMGNELALPQTDEGFRPAPQTPNAGFAPRTDVPDLSRFQNVRPNDPTDEVTRQEMALHPRNEERESPFGLPDSEASLRSGSPSVGFYPGMQTNEAPLGLTGNESRTKPNVGFYPGMPSDATGKRINEIQERQGRKLNPNFNPDLPEGTDNQKYVNHKRSFLKFLGSAGLGALRGAATGNLAGALGGAIAGTIGEGVDPNFFRKQGDQIKLGQLQPVYEGQVAREKQKQARDLRDAQIRDSLAKPEDRDEERKRKKLADDHRYEMQGKTLDWKKEDREEYYRLEEVKMAAKDKNDERTYNLAERKQKEIERNNKAVITSREKIANEGNKTKIAIAGGNQVAAAGRQDAKSADEAAKVLAAIRLNAPQGTTEEQIQQKQQAYLGTLRPEIRSKIPQ